MKPNVITRLVALALPMLLGVCLFSASASAQKVEGKFTLPCETRWASAVLPAGQYQLTFNVGQQVFMIRNGTRGESLVIARPVDTMPVSSDSSLVIVRHGRTAALRTLTLGPIGTIYHYSLPKSWTTLEMVAGDRVI